MKKSCGSTRECVEKHRNLTQNRYLTHKSKSDPQIEI